MSKTQDLYKQAKLLIPGGTQLLSKRAEMFLPDQWPAYYKKAKGCEIWDLDGNHYYDLSIMGIGTCVLGYANDEINTAVKKAIDEGSMATLNSYEEVELAEKLIELHPWAQMVRFSRTGGEACAISVRIARAFTKKDKVAFCGYHGWHDWYLASNLSDGKNLDGQLLSGLDPAGVPKVLMGTALPFYYGKIDELKEIVKKNKNELAAVIMEVSRYTAPDESFLKTVRRICDEENIILIFDEVSSGFRMNTGGSHLLFGINPDICILGKALGNGHPISAILGKKNVMDAAQLSFISSSYWTERVGFVAALKTLEIFERDCVAEKICGTGRYIKEGLTKIFSELDLKMKIIGVDSVPIIAIEEMDPLVVKTILTQQMLKKGFLASNIIYVSTAHEQKIVDQYLKAIKEVLIEIKQAIHQARLKSMLEGPVCHAGFKRLS